jgi:hypothetical protein
MDRRAGLFIPAHRRSVDRHRDGIGTELHFEAERRVASLQSIPKVGGEIGGILWRIREGRNRRYGCESVLDRCACTKREADETEVPILAGAPSVQANIHEDKNPADDQCPSATIGTPPLPAPRAVATLRLLQVDVAVREPRADATTGWVFGTFIYNGTKAGTDPWTKLDPVGLMWGNDPQLTDEDAASGKQPAEGVVLSDFGFKRNFGRGGRMNGPVDNSVSSCLSCHMTAQWPTVANMTPRGGTNWAIVGCWFRNLGPASPFGNEPGPGKGCGSDAANVTSLDFSLQLAVGRRNWEINKASGMFSTVVQGGGLPSTLPAASTFAFDDLTLDVGGMRSLPVHR